MRVRFGELTWPEIEEILQMRHAVILPVGSTEEHGAHLPVNVDSMEATYLSEQTAKKIISTHKDLSVLVAPTIHYTDISAHKMFPGSIGVSIDTLIKTIRDIVESLLDQGFNNIIAFVSHRENNCSVEAALRMINDKYPHAHIFAVSMVSLGWELRLKICKAGLVGVGHALEAETAMSLVMQPQNVKLDRTIKGSRELPLPEKFIGNIGKDQHRGILYYPPKLLRGWEKSGISGDPTMASAEEGTQIINAVVDDFPDIIVRVINL
jgi:creatinine amidohydrolase